MQFMFHNNITSNSPYFLFKPLIIDIKQPKSYDKIQMCLYCTIKMQRIVIVGINNENMGGR